MKILKHVFVIIILGAGFTFAQSQVQPTTSFTQGNLSSAMPNNLAMPVEDVYFRENIIPEKKPVPYSYIREADVMWAKDIWRIIDLRQRMNFPLRYPDYAPIEDRYSLYLLLMEGIWEGSITPYKFTEFNNPFAERTSKEQLEKELDIFFIYDDNDSTKIISKDFKGTSILQFYVREKWYFDKQHSEMRVRIVALAPVMYKPDPAAPGGTKRTVPFFVYFPECRRMFATHSVFNPNNDAQSISFDDLFMQRRFASTIAGESNIHANRQIIDFMSGQDALMEAERIKNDIFIQEHDLWEY